MFRLEFRLCGPLVKCLAEIGAESLSAVTSFVDAEALEELAKDRGGGEGRRGRLRGPPRGVQEATRRRAQAAG
jgi:hypothetical protein